MIRKDADRCTIEHRAEFCEDSSDPESFFVRCWTATLRIGKLATEKRDCLAFLHDTGTEFLIVRRIGLNIKYFVGIRVCEEDFLRSDCLYLIESLIAFSIPCFAKLLRVDLGESCEGRN